MSVLLAYATHITIMMKETDIAVDNALSSFSVTFLPLQCNSDPSRQE